MLERLARLIESRLREYFDRRFDELKQEIKTMGTTISSEQDANTAAITTDLAEIKTGVTNLQAQLAAANVKAGETISQAQEDSLTAARTTADQLAAVFAPPPPPAPAA